MLQNRANIKQLRIHLLAELRKVYAETEASSITRLILEHTGYPSSLYLHDPEMTPDSQTIAQINEIVTEIHTGKPIQYILGYTYFCDLKLKVNENVLIPRPETEEMIYHIKSDSPQADSHIIDLGTGSGCIALALKNLFPGASVSGLDVSQKALDTARQNGVQNKLDICWMKCDLLHMPSFNFERPFSMVASNPPYVLNSERQFMAKNVLQFEPETALFVEDGDPLIYYRAIASFCGLYLESNGVLWTEINEALGPETVRLFKGSGLREVNILKDIHGKDRFIKARK